MDLDEEVYEKFPKLVKKVLQEEGIKDLDGSALSELFKYAVMLSGSKKKMSVVMGSIVDVIKEANAFSEGERIIRGEHIKRAIEEKFYRSNLLEEKNKEIHLGRKDPMHGGWQEGRTGKWFKRL